MILARDLQSVGIVEGDWSARSGYEAARRLLRGDRPTAIVAANDQMALGAMLAVGDEGLRVPADVSVTGIDDTPEAGFYNPPLTTVRVDFRAQGRRAVATLLTHAGIEEPLTVTAEPVELMVRRSTGTAPSAR